MYYRDDIQKVNSTLEKDLNEDRHKHHNDYCNNKYFEEMHCMEHCQWTYCCPMISTPQIMPMNMMPSQVLPEQTLPQTEPLPMPTETMQNCINYDNTDTMYREDDYRLRPYNYRPYPYYPYYPYYPPFSLYSYIKPWWFYMY